MAALPEVLPAGPVELRRWRAAEIDVLMSVVEVSQAELARWLPWADPMPSRDDELAFLRTGEATFDADEQWGYFLFEHATGELVGGVVLHPNRPGEVEIGYGVRSDRTRRGFATAAARALTDAAFELLPGVTRVVIRMDQANLASAAVPPKLGFRLEGEDVLREVLTSGHTGKGWIWTCGRDDLK